MIDRASETWRAIEAFAMQEIESARSSLETPLEQREADMERGRIVAMRRLLRMARPAAPPEMASPKGSPYA